MNEDKRDELRHEGKQELKKEVIEREVERERDDRREKSQNTIGKKPLLLLLILALLGGGGYGIGKIGSTFMSSSGKIENKDGVLSQAAKVGEEVYITVRERAIELNGKIASLEEVIKYLDGLDKTKEVTLRDANAIKDTYESLVKVLNEKGLSIKRVME